MHSLETIIDRNAKAAGREAAHAINDGKTVKAIRIFMPTSAWDAERFDKGYTQGLQER